MNILFITNYEKKYGIGHLNRCNKLAKKIKKGNKIFFLVDKIDKNLPRLIRDKKDSMMFNLPIVPSTPNPIIPPPVVSTIQPAISMPMQPMPAPKPLAIDDVSSDIPMLDVNQYEKIKRNAKKRRQKRKTRKAKKTPFDNKSEFAKRRLSKTKKRKQKLRQSALNKKRMERNMIRQQKRQSPQRQRIDMKPVGNILDRIPRRDRYRSLDDTLAENQRMIENMSRNRGSARRQAERWWAM